MSELSDLLTSICSLFPATVQLGDFNIHANSSRSSFAREFLSLADCLNFTQHVKCLSMSEVTRWIWFSPLALPFPIWSAWTFLFLTISLSAFLFLFLGCTLNIYRNQKQGSVFSTLALNNVIEIHFASDPPNTMIDMLVDYYNAAISSSLYSLSHPQNLDCLFYLPCPMVYYVSPWPKDEWPPTLEALHKNHEVYKYHVRPHKEALSQAKAPYYSSLIHQQQLQLQLTLATSVSSSSSTFLQPLTLFFTPSFSPA